MLTPLLRLNNQLPSDMRQPSPNVLTSQIRDYGNLRRIGARHRLPNTVWYNDFNAYVGLRSRAIVESLGIK